MRRSRGIRPYNAPMPHHNDILGKIKKAQSAEEIDALVAEAAMFQSASTDTRNRIQRKAALRRKELEEAK